MNDRREIQKMLKLLDNSLKTVRNIEETTNNKRVLQQCMIATSIFPEVKIPDHPTIQDSVEIWKVINPYTQFVSSIQSCVLISSMRNTDSRRR